MEFRIVLPASVDLPQVAAAIEERDPAAVVDMDPASGKLRVSTWITALELGAALQGCGASVAPGDEEYKDVFDPSGLVASQKADR